MYCKICGTENPDEALYCKNCGNPMVEKKEVINCPHCEQENDKESVFCKKCGKELLLVKDNDTENYDSGIYSEGIGAMTAGLLLIFGSAPFGGFLLGFFIYLVEGDDDSAVAMGAICAGISILIGLFLIITSFFIKELNVKNGEYIVMEKKEGIGTVWLTNKRLISRLINSKGVDFDLKSKDINIQLWKSTFGSKKGIIITQKYETPIKIKLEKPDKWYDKIIELRNS